MPIYLSHVFFCFEGDPKVVFNILLQGVGWFFWTAKTEENCAPEWDFLFLLEQGIAPANLCERQSYCNFDL